MVLTVFSEDLQKASRDKTENNNIQMKQMIDSFEVQKKKKAKKVNKWGKMEQKWTWNEK